MSSGSYKFYLFAVAILLFSLKNWAEPVLCESLRMPNTEESEALFRFRESLIRSVDYCYSIQPKGSLFDQCLHAALTDILEPVAHKDSGPFLKQKMIEALIESHFYSMVLQTLGNKGQTLFQSWNQSRLKLLKGRGLFVVLESRFKRISKAISEAFRNKRQYLTRVMSSPGIQKPDLSQEYQKVLTEEALAHFQLYWVQNILEHEFGILTENRINRKSLVLNSLQGLAGVMGFLGIVYYGRYIFEPLQASIGAIGAGCTLGALGGTAIHLIEKTTHSLARAFRQSTQNRTPLSCEWAHVMDSAGDQWLQLIQAAAFGSASGCVIVGAAIVAPRTTTLSLTASLGESLIENGYKTGSSIKKGVQELDEAEAINQVMQTLNNKKNESDTNVISKNLGLFELQEARQFYLLKNQRGLSVEQRSLAEQHLLMAQKHFADAGESAVQTLISGLLMRGYVKSWFAETELDVKPQKISEEHFEAEAIDDALKANPKSGKAAKAFGHATETIANLAHKFTAKLNAISIPGSPGKPEVSDSDSSYYVFQELWNRLFGPDRNKADSKEQ